MSGVISWYLLMYFFFFKHKTAYDMRISDWSSDVCSSDLISTVGEDRGHGDIAYQAVTVAPADIEGAVVNLLRLHDAETAMLFCATRDNVRSEERRVGKEWVSTCRSRWSPYHSKKK